MIHSPAISKRLLLVVAGFVTVAGNLRADDSQQGDRHSQARQPQIDSVYLQEVNRQVLTADPLTALAVFGGQVYAGSEQGLRRFNGDRLIQ